MNSRVFCVIHSLRLIYAFFLKQTNNKLFTAEIRSTCKNSPSFSHMLPGINGHSDIAWACQKASDEPPIMLEILHGPSFQVPEGVRSCLSLPKQRAYVQCQEFVPPKYSVFTSLVLSRVFTSLFLSRVFTSLFLSRVFTSLFLSRNEPGGHMKSGPKPSVLNPQS